MGGFGPIIQGAGSNKPNNLEVAIESRKAKGTGGVRDFQTVFEKTTKDLENVKACIDKLGRLPPQPAAVTDAGTDEAKASY